MDKNQLDGLVALKLVADLRSFTAAAEALKISPSAISKMIKQFETRLGAPLLIRTTRTTRLTEVGQKFLNQAGPALDQILSAMIEVGNLSDKPTGTLRLNAPQFVYPYFLKKAVVSFLKKYPDISVDVSLENESTDIFDRGFDAGIRLYHILAKDMVAIKLFGPIRFVIAGSPKYFSQRGKPKHPQDLLSHSCIVARLENGLYDDWEFEHKGKAFNVRVKGPLILNDHKYMVDATVDGLGLMYVNEDDIEDKVKSGRLETVLTQFVPDSEGCFLYFPQHSQAQPKLRAFIEHLKSIQKGKEHQAPTSSAN